MGSDLMARGRAGKSATAAVLLLALLGIWRPASAAVSPCQGSPTSRFVGAHTTFRVSIFGGRAHISPQNPDLCGSTSVSVAWSMVTAHVEGEASSVYGWAQVGFGRFGADAGFQQSGYKVFAQYENKCDLYTGEYCSPVTRFDPAPTDTTYYSNMYKSLDQHIHMYAYQTQVAETGFNPISIWDAEWQDQFYGETKHLRTDVPGTNGNRVQFTDLQKLTDGSGTWADIQNVTLSTDACRYNDHALSGTNFEIWTQPLDSTSC